MDIEKLFKEFVEKEWHDGHEPQGEHDHYDEDEEVEEARTYIDRKYEKKKKGFTPQSQKKKRWGSGGYGKGEEVEEDLKLIAVSEDICDVSRGDLNSAPMKTAWDKKCGSGKKKHTIVTKSLRSVYDKAEFDPFIEEALGEGYKDLPPHLQKLIKKIEKKQKDWNKQNPDAKIQTLVYNPETGKPDIIVKETMKLEDTIKQVVMGEHKGDKPHKHPHEDEVKKEDSDKDEPGTQGDMAAYQKKRKAIAKKFGVKSCSELDGADKKACYAALDKAHVADHEEQVELENMKKEEVSEAFWKVNIPDMPPVFIEAGSSSEIKKDMRKKLKPDVFKELVVERVTRSEMIKKYREMVKGDSGEEEPKEKEEETSISKMYGHVQNLMKGN